jgi:nitric oxide reductase subunit C
MFLRAWIVLFIVFVSYTVYLYLNCDDQKSNLPNKAAIAGRNTWQQYNCQGCHQIYGLGGYMGPDLTNIISTKGVRNAETFIKYGTGRMPNQHLSDSDISNLIAFLSWIDKTGKSKVPKEAVHWTGTYIIK